MKNGKTTKTSTLITKIKQLLEARTIARSLRVKAIEELEHKYPTPPTIRVPIEHNGKIICIAVRHTNWTFYQQ